MTECKEHLLKFCKFIINGFDDLGDTVYVLRDVTEGEGESQSKVTYKTIKDPKYGDMDIFRIERLWKDEK